MNDDQETFGASGDQAADWFVRLQSDAATRADWTAFEAWLQADERHGPAFEVVESLWVDLELAPLSPASSGRGSQVLTFSRRRASSAWIRGGALGALAAAAAAFVFLVWRPNLRPNGADGRSVATLAGQRLSLSLPDGSRVELNGGSKIRYRFTTAQRLATLETGEAIFSVTHNPHRPFGVLVGDRRITDVGTVFDVKRFDQATEVTVKEGQVSVGPATDQTQPQTSLGAGGQLTHQDGQSRSLVTSVDPDAVMAWRIDRLVYHDASLQTVVSDLNQHFPIPIHVKGHKTAELRFSGVLVLDSEDAVIGRLQAFMPVVVERSDGALWLTGRR